MLQMKRFLRISFVIIVLALVLFQLYPKSNINVSSGIDLNDISMAHHVPVPVQQILKTSCYDCHSNHTIYPWYAKIQPVSLWLANHIKDGKAELNFSIFGSYRLSRQYRKLQEINDQVKKAEMPLKSYIIIHRDAALTPEQTLVLGDWVRSLRDSFRVKYPIDSLQKKK